MNFSKRRSGDPTTWDTTAVNDEIDHVPLRLARIDTAQDPRAAGAGRVGCTYVLSAVERGALLGVIDAAAGIRTLNELWRWSRGALQRILPHGMFACGMGAVRNRSEEHTSELQSHKE